MWFLHQNPDFLVCSWSNQTFLNIFERSNQRRVQLDWSFSDLLTKYREHGSHGVVVLELHMTELHFFGWADRCTSILNTVHPACIYVVELTINFTQLILQYKKHDKISNLEHIRFSLVVVNSNYFGVKINDWSVHDYLVWFTTYENKHTNL